MWNQGINRKGCKPLTAGGVGISVPNTTGYKGLQRAPRIVHGSAREMWLQVKMTLRTGRDPIDWQAVRDMGICKRDSHRGLPSPQESRPAPTT